MEGTGGDSLGKGEVWGEAESWEPEAEGLEAVSEPRWRPRS